LKHLISAVVKNEVGILAHISGLFSARGYNIDSLNVGETDDPHLSRMTIVVDGDDAILEQVVKQLRKLISVVKVDDMTGRHYVERDLMLIKVGTPPGKRGELIGLVEVFRGKVVDISHKDMVVELSGPEAKLEAFIALCRSYGIREVVRSGRIAMSRGTKEG